MRNADRILVLEAGKLVAEGPRAQLIKTSPLYFPPVIYQNQFLATKPATEEGPESMQGARKHRKKHGKRASCDVESATIT